MFSERRVSLAAAVVLLVLGTTVRAQGSSSFDHLDQGLQIVGKFVQQYLNAQPDDVQISNGVHLISVRHENDARANLGDDGTLLGAVENYLSSHELRIRLPELLPNQGLGRAFKEAVEGVKDSELGTGRGKGGGGKGGMGGIMMMGLMMGKMMAALGLGGVGLLAMKALMISALALMLSMIIGLKKLVSSDHDDGGHTVIHASHGSEHHRRKREASNLAYRAYVPQA